MRFLSLCIALLASLHPAFAQYTEPDCGWYGNKTVEERNALFPFNVAKKVVLVAYPPRVVTSLDGMDQADFVPGCTYYGREIIGNLDIKIDGEILNYPLYEKKEITGAAIDELSNIMLNYTTNPDKEVGWEPTNCSYWPRNSVLFYDENNTLIADFGICFSCGYLLFLPKGQDPLADAIEHRCPRFMDLLGDFFKQQGIVYGVTRL